MNNLMIIHRNGPVNQPAYMNDRDDEALEIDIDGIYRCSLRKNKNDAEPALTFVTGGGSGVGTLSVLTDDLDGEVRDYFLFEAEQALIADLPLGAYHADILRDDDPNWEFDFVAVIEQGVTAAP